MLIHIFNERVYTTKEIPSRAGGMYPIYLDGKILANITTEKGVYYIQLASDFTSRAIYFEKPRLDLYRVYSITSRQNDEHFFLIATKSYDESMTTYDILNQITIGSDKGCDVYYPLEFKSQEFLRVTLIKQDWIVETNSYNFFISGKRVEQRQKIFVGDTIFFYGLKIIFMGEKIIISDPEKKALLQTQRTKVSALEKNLPPYQPEIPVEILPLYGKGDYYYKTPRFNYLVETVDVEVDEPPNPDDDDDMPMILTIGPQITMAAMSVLSVVGIVISSANSSAGSFTMGFSIAAMCVTVIGTLSWPIIRRKFNKSRRKKREARRRKKYEKYLIRKKNWIDFIKLNQKQILLDNNPMPEECVQIIKTKDKRLWQRNIGHEDFLSVRLGIGKVATKININKPKEQFSINDDDDLFLAMKKLESDSLYIDGGAITYSLVDQNIDAIVGDKQCVKNFADCLFLQILSFHSYIDLKIVVLVNNPEEWNYLKTVPHIWDAQKKTRYFTTSTEELANIAIELEKIFDARKENNEEVRLEDDGSKDNTQTDYQSFKPYYLFFIDDMASVRNISLINKILHYKRNLGFSILTVTQNVSSLPNETTDFIYVSPQKSAIMRSDNTSNQEIFVADFNNGRVDMYEIAQKMANIPMPAERGKFELPKSISFLELYKFGRVEQLDSRSKWIKNNPSLSLSVPIGIDQNGETFFMDIHEKAFGPHGLIAGTTGSGKSEWIVTYILSLAVNFSPEEVQFVLIDYKGGGLAKSFENAELNIRLPHLAGTITNLDKSEIFRSISAIESELKRRQAIFNAAREKLKESQMDIYKYQQSYRKKLVDEPMSHLLIICDEFAELKQQEPEFMEQLISTSRIGRSLGVHLILATQKPSGVVNDQIWSNSKFKVCLKVQDRSDSSEILKKPDAAFLKQTGSFYIQVGNDDYYNLGQSAWAGAKYYPSNTVNHKIDESVECIDNIGQIIDSLGETKEVREAQGEELLNIVAYVSDVSKDMPLRLRNLWLKSIPSHIFLADLYQKYQITPSEKYTYETVVGEYDEPRQQKQAPLKVDLADGNIAIIGKADSSIEKLISTMIWSSICEKTPAEIAYYIIDFGTETLKKFADFPHVGEVIFQDELDRVAGLLNMISDEIERRKEFLSNYNGSFEYYNKVEQEKLNLIVVVINNFDIFSEVLPRMIEVLNVMFRDAPKYGIIFIVSSNAINAIGNRQLQFFNHLILMQLSDDSQYRGLSNCRRGLLPKKVVGRGICKVDPNNNDSYCEFQTAMIDTEENELKTIKAYAEECMNYYKCKVRQLPKIPEDVKSEDLADYVTTLSAVPIGVSLMEKDIAKYDFLNQKIHLVAGKNINSSINFLYGLASILSKVENVTVRVIDMLGIFKKPILDIKMFNENIDVVFGALEKDALTRNETQGYGINIILGAGQYKQYLSSGGIEIFKNLFANVPRSRKSIYVLVDDYENLRSLKLEEWFTQIDTSQGIWLGQGLNSQSLFDCDTVSSEDSKFDFPGLLFEINNGEYKIIKGIMDKDD